MKNRVKFIYGAIAFVLLFAIIGAVPFVVSKSRKAKRKNDVVSEISPFVTDKTTLCETETELETEKAEVLPKKRVALTFDDGPHKKYTKEILDILKEYDIKATFFVVGRNAKAYPDIIKRMYEEGHEIGNHTYSHPRVKEESINDILNEIVETENLIEELTGHKTDLFRPPNGICTESVKTVAKERNYHIVLWTIDTLDWTCKSSKDISKCVLNEVKDGSVILMHDFIAKNSPTPETLRIIIPKLLEEGYTFVTVYEIINKKVGTR